MTPCVRVGLSILVGAGLLGLPLPALAQAPIGDPAAYPISLGGRGWSAVPASRETTPRNLFDIPFELSARAGVASDYIYRGVTLSARQPVIGAGIEAALAGFYAGMTAARVKLPTDPNAEITFTGGYRRSIANVDLDFGVAYYFYPGEMRGGPTAGIEYWEATARADTRITESFGMAGGFGYSPDVSNTGAWSWYAAAGAGYVVPSRLIPLDIGVMFTAAAGYSWFGRQSLWLGGSALPAYLNWQAGVTLSHKSWNLDLRYYDTNLSREDCYVFTGDPGARPGGSISPISNPDGLTSRWCSSTVVAKLWFELSR